jgi:hypothetical protein
MTFGQRFLYVGVGGSGQTIGRELERMLRKQICGSNGNKARSQQDGIKGLEPHELPSFIQTLYIDFAEADLATTLETLASGNKEVAMKTATFVHALPKYASSNQITNQLRTAEHGVTQSWLPPQTGDWGTEPTFAPLTVGAGQYPTIGRAALFALIQDRGPEALFKQFDTALGRIDNALGDLKRYNPKGQVTEKIIVLIGGSMSGGTGGGILYDIVQLFAQRALDKLATQIIVVPLIALPSAFDSVLSESKRRSSRLNSARGLADVGRLIDEQNAPPPGGAQQIEYPHNLRFSLQPGVVKPAFLFDTPVDMQVRGEHIEHSIARFAVDLVSSVETESDSKLGSASTRPMPLVDKLVNDTGLLQLQHPTYVGNRPFAMAATVDIQDEKDKLATLIAEELFAEYVQHTLDNEKAAVQADQITKKEFAREVGLFPPAKFDDLKTFRDQVTNAMDAGQVAQANGIYKSWAERYCIVDEKALDDIKKSPAAGALDAIKLVPDRLAPRNLPALLSKLSARESKRTIVDSVLAVSASLGTVGASGLAHQGPTPAPFPKTSELLKWKVLRFPPARVKRNDVDDLFARAEASAGYIAWSTFLNTGAGERVKVAAKESKLWIDALMTSLDLRSKNIVKNKTQRHEALSTASLLDDSGADSAEYYKAMQQKVAERLASKVSADKGVNADVARKVILANQERILKRWIDDDRHAVDRLGACIIEELQSAVLAVLEDTTDSSYKGLVGILDSAKVSSDVTTFESAAVARLRGMIVNRASSSLVPPVDAIDAETRLTISFPGANTNAKKEWFKDVLKANSKLLPFLEKVNFVPNSASDSISINLSVVGLGLLDVPDAARSVNTWISAAHKPMGTDRIAWRQRVGYRDSIDFISYANRITMIQQLITAAYNGNLTERIVAGQEHTNELELRFGAPESEALRIPLKGALPNRLAQMPDAFLEAIALDCSEGKSRRVTQILSELMELRPAGAASSSITPGIPELFKDFAGIAFKTGSSRAESEIALIKKRLSTQSSDASTLEEQDLYSLRQIALKEFLRFWEVDVVTALKKPYNIVGFNSIWEICDAIQNPTDGGGGDFARGKRN